MSARDLRSIADEIGIANAQVRACILAHGLRTSSSSRLSRDFTAQNKPALSTPPKAAAASEHPHENEGGESLRWERRKGGANQPLIREQSFGEACREDVGPSPRDASGRWLSAGVH
jgi:hypothetical protein